MIITIDGLTGSGTTSNAKLVADSLGCLWFSAGGDFRALAYEVIHQKIARTEGKQMIGNEADIINLAKSISIEHDGHGSVIVNGKDVSSYLDDLEVTRLVAHISSIKEVRDIHNQRMRRFAKEHSNVVFEGRPTGWIFPEAIKFWLEADKEKKHGRVANQRGEEVAAHNEHRDMLDTEREVEPARPTPDATIIDTNRLDAGGAATVILQAVSELSAA